MNNADQAYASIRRMLVAGELVPGQRLSSLELARRFQTSNMPVRQALARLQSEGVVDLIPNSGHVVRTLGRDEIDELLEYRAQVEGLAAVGAARHASKRALGAIEDICDAMAKLAAAAQLAGADQRGRLHLEMVRLDYLFHQAVAESAGNRWLLRNIEQLGFFVLAFRDKRETPDLLAERLQHIDRSHRALFELMAAGSADAARAVMEDHVRRGRAFHFAATAEELAAALRTPPVSPQESSR
jgi:DNA-binding GntR family transcriptional regulator